MSRAMALDGLLPVQPPSGDERVERRALGTVPIPVAPPRVHRVAGCLCCRCGWGKDDHHTTRHGERHGLFPLCKRCWAALATPAMRWPFYAQLLAEWREDGYDSEDDRAIYDAVMRGL